MVIFVKNGRSNRLINSIGPAGQQTYRAYVLNIPATTTATATATTAPILPNW